MIVHKQCMEVVDSVDAFASYASAFTRNYVRDAAWIGDSGCGRLPGGVWHMNLLRALAAHSEKGGLMAQ